MLTAAPQEYWDNLYEQRRLEYDEDGVLFKELFDTYLPRGGTCFEVGCFPGPFLIYLGRRFDYTVSGIDATPGMSLMEPHLRAHNVKVGRLFQGDFFATPIAERYDVVCSFGFIEHFRDTRKVIERHAELVAPGGRLVLSCPNFRGVQWLLHRWLDPENLSRHVVEAMDLPLWKGVLGDLGFSVLHSGYDGTFNFWTEDPMTSLIGRFAKRTIVRLGRGIDRRIDMPSRSFSPYLVLIAERS